MDLLIVSIFIVPWHRIIGQVAKGQRALYQSSLCLLMSLVIHNTVSFHIFDGFWDIFVIWIVLVSFLQLMHVVFSRRKEIDWAQAIRDNSL